MMLIVFSIGCTHPPSPGTFRERTAQIHRPHPVLQAGLERRRPGGHVRRSNATSPTHGTERCHHVRHVRGDTEGLGHAGLEFPISSCELFYSLPGKGCWRSNWFPTNFFAQNLAMMIATTPLIGLIELH